jgi:hypothetical protein
MGRVWLGKHGFASRDGQVGVNLFRSETPSFYPTQQTDYRPLNQL